MMLKQSTLQLLRIKFSFFLMPIYWFALSSLVSLNMYRSIIIFIILHLFLYPASNAYNSYMDRDTKSIAGVEKPLQPTKELFYVSLVLDGMAFITGLIISFYFAACITIFIAASRAYSYRGIRLKKYPIISFFTAIIFQGSMVFFMTYHGSSLSQTLEVPYLPMIISALLVGSFYPLTQIYQHAQDREDGVQTLSMLLGYRGTFIFTAFIFFITLILMVLFFAFNLELDRFLVVIACMFPVSVYFIKWFLKVRKNPDAANYKNSMKMSFIAALCTNAAFLILLITERF
ncbi:MAG: UbiA prenyltransferase family protein [Cytophagales bacterium]|nr:UbiA prenyltransferase family protein [Cytophaga sp.]